MAAAPSTRNQRITLVVTAAAVGATRFVPLSKGPWDWDEVLFCLAVRDYDVGAHQPHPPGFPLYILLAKAARLFAESDFHALQVVNVLAALCVFPVMYWLARSLRFEFFGAMTAATLFAFLPNVWFYGGTAFSDIPAMVLFLGASAALLGAATSTRGNLTGAVLLGAGILMRPQNAAVAVYPWIKASLSLLRGRRMVVFLLSSVVVVAIVAAGFGAAAIVTGTDRYLAATKVHGEFVRRMDSVAASDRPPLLRALRMQLDPSDAGKAALMMNAVALVGIVAGRRRRTAEILLTFAPCFMMSLVITNPHGAGRFSLAWIGGVALLFAEGAEALGRLIPRWRLAVPAVLTAVLLGRLVTWTLPAFETPRSSESPAVAAALWIRERAEGRTIFYDQSIWPWARYYLPPARAIHVHEPIEVLRHPDVHNGWYLTRERPAAMKVTEFARPRNRTWNIVTKRSFEAWAQPASEVVHYGQGWWPQEEGGGRSWRWAGAKSEMTFAPFEGRRRMLLRYLLPVDALGHPLRVRFLWNGEEVGSAVSSMQQETTVELELTGSNDRPNVLSIEASEAFVPAAMGQGDDRRELALQLQWWKWSEPGEERSRAE